MRKVWGAAVALGAGCCLPFSLFELSCFNKKEYLENHFLCACQLESQLLNYCLSKSRSFCSAWSLSWLVLFVSFGKFVMQSRIYSANNLCDKTHFLKFCKLFRLFFVFPFSVNCIFFYEKFVRFFLFSHDFICYIYSSWCIQIWASQAVLFLPLCDCGDGGDKLVQ